MFTDAYQQIAYMVNQLNYVWLTAEISVTIRPAPIMLEVLPIILSRIFHKNFAHYSFDDYLLFS